MECGECEMNLAAGHAPDCSRRCQIIDSDGTQCERRQDHRGVHRVYEDADGDPSLRSWPARLGEPRRTS